MDKKAIFKLCKDQGCCDGCAVRFLGVKHPNAYEDLKKHITQYQESSTNNGTATDSTETNSGLNTEDEKKTDKKENGHSKENGDDSPVRKRRKTEACVCCLGVLEEETWPECNLMLKEVLEKKGYDCQSFACALSAPISTLLREKVLVLKIREAFPDYDPACVTPLKEAWKWSFGAQLERPRCAAATSLLVTVTLEYPSEMPELELLKTISPELFESRSKQKRRFAVEFTRRSAEQALEGPVERIMKAGESLREAGRVRCVSVACVRDPIYVGGRYVKLSRELSQTPWLVDGNRMMESSVQEVIFDPLAKMLDIAAEEAEHRLKFMSAGREDVDARCLGDGRPFAVEVADPRRMPTSEDYAKVCNVICKSGTVIVKKLCTVSKEELTILKQGEESKHKTYEALCIKLSHSAHETEKTPSDPVTVTPQDIANINSYRNTPPSNPAAVIICQRTPIRVLHRRPLLARQREILSLKAETVPDHPQLFTLHIQTSAGTYVKEWVHGELGRCKPSLRDAIQASVDILALDVAKVHLNWPSQADC
ncbi:putative tRNA pseudouridine synthase Pus10 [Plodia interpunctella]|uniref:putative tRNA pseudouridine synthase Pus10 n=1 Tax=Plodia interpunctella TaxID=58824 RepID=UPI002367B15C|nr:putative tRNA pseudouridine synthase Pus10 [Plodia interpunctella]